MSLVNALYVRFACGYGWVEDTASIAVHERREGYLALGQAGSADEAQRIAEAVLAGRTDPVVATAASLEPAPADEPYVTWDVGDTITMPDEDGTPTPMRVLALSMQTDEEGNPIWTPELRSLEQEQEQRFAQTLKRMTNGTLGGTTASASPGLADSATCGYSALGSGPSGVVTLRPNETVDDDLDGTGNPWAAFPSGTIHGVTADVSDSTYATVTSGNNGDPLNNPGPMVLGFDTFAFGGASIVSVTLRIRARYVVAGQVAHAQRLGTTNQTGDTETLTAAFADYTGATWTTKPGGGSWTQSDIDGLRVLVTPSVTFDTGQTVQVAAIYADVVYSV